jgi:hypothetical protein
MEKNMSKNNCINNCIILNTTSFDKFSKRLYQELQKESELSLSKIKEITSKSLGFRNYNGLKEYLNLPSLNVIEKSSESSFKTGYVVKNNQFLKRFTNENILSIASILIKVDDMWGERALILLKTVLSLLDVINMEKNTDNICDYVLFDKLFSFYKTTDNEKAKELIFNYCTNTLPGFDKNRYNELASSQNSYLSSQIIPVLEFFKQIEKQDCLMFSLDWLTNNLNQSLTIDMLNELPKATKKELESANDWDSFFKLNHLKFQPQLLKTEAYDDSWLCDEAFVSIIKSKLLTLKDKDFYFSDFLYGVSKIINTEKKKIYIQLLQSMKHNYESCVQYSGELYYTVHQA